MNGHLLFSAIVSLLLSVSMPAAMAQESIAKPELDKSMLLIEDSIAKLKLLERQIRDTSGADREALVFRFDQRIIRLMDWAVDCVQHSLAFLDSQFVVG